MSTGLAPVKVAVAQSLVQGSVVNNGNEIRRLISQAKKGGASIVHFCEGALTGYAKQQIKSAESIDFASIRKEIEEIRNLCK